MNKNVYFFFFYFFLSVLLLVQSVVYSQFYKNKVHNKLSSIYHLYRVPHKIGRVIAIPLLEEAVKIKYETKGFNINKKGINDGWKLYTNWKKKNKNKKFFLGFVFFFIDSTK